MKRARNKGGFTLIEILVSLAILGIVLTGIYSVYTMQHKSYIVQEQVAEMQQNERIALQMITRDIRMAGLGLQFCDNNAGGKIIFSEGTTKYNGSGYDGSDKIGVEYHTFSPKGGANTQLTKDLTSIGTSAELDVQDTTGFSAGDWVMVRSGDLSSCHYALICITNVQTTAKKLQHNPTDTSPCANKTIYNNKLGSGFKASDWVRKVNSDGGGIITYAIGDGYQLTRQVDSGDAQPLADNIEDMQIAYGIDVNNNGVVEDPEWFNDPTGKDMTLLREIRVTLVARTTRQDPEWKTGARPVVEDHTADLLSASTITTPAQAIQYRRRVLQSIIKLRDVETSAVF